MRILYSHSFLVNTAILAVLYLGPWSYPLLGDTKPGKSAESDQRVAPICPAAAEEAAKRHIEREVSLKEYNVEVRSRQGHYSVLFTRKEPSHGGMIEVWIHGETGRVVTTHWYQ
jgi:hypothetical protein